MTWLTRLFSGAPLDTSRFRPAGLAVMLAGLVAVALAGRLGRRHGDKAELGLRLGGMLVCMLGALVTMKIL